MLVKFHVQIPYNVTVKYISEHPMGVAVVLVFTFVSWSCILKVTMFYSFYYSYNPVKYVLLHRIKENVLFMNCIKRSVHLKMKILS